MFQFLLLLSCLTLWTAEAARPGEACCSTNPCSSSFCIGGYCSSCSDDNSCPLGNYCIVQNPPPSAGLKYQVCFPGDHPSIFFLVSLSSLLFNFFDLSRFFSQLSFKCVLAETNCIIKKVFIRKFLLKTINSTE
jgi:hypothetical protein